MRRVKIGYRWHNLVNLKWRPNLAYAVGLIASDGCLGHDSYRIQFVSKDSELIKLYQRSLGLHKRPIPSARGGETEKKYSYVQFKSKQFHSFLISIGVTPLKSKTIHTVEVPDKYFADFLRGVFDGDGTFWTWWDKRWPNSFGYTLGISSASLAYINWLKKKLYALYGVKGVVHNGNGAYTLRYVKGDTQKLFAAMYYRKGLLRLSRKYIKIKKALDFDANLKHSRRRNKAAVAQW